MRHYFRINKQINLPLSLEAEDYLEEYGLRKEVIQWRDNFCVLNNYHDFQKLKTQSKRLNISKQDFDDAEFEDSKLSCLTQSDNSKEDDRI